MGMMVIRGMILLLIVLSSACGAATQPTVTPTLTPSETPSATASATPLPTDTPTSTSTPTATATSLPTETPTSTFTPTDTPTVTPQPTIFRFDNWDMSDIPDIIRDGISNPMIAFVNLNDSETIANLSTAQPSTNVETLYYTSATNPADRTAILELPASTGNQIFIAPLGNSVAYFVDDPTTRGLYVLDLSSGLSGRILPIASLVQRGLFSEPTWNPDGSRLAIALATEHGIDIFSFAKDASDWENLTQNEAFDFWPQWSPNGRYILFVSDRARCLEGTCGEQSGAAPTGGQIYTLEVNTGTITPISDQWVSDRQVVFGVSDPTELLNPERAMWIADVVTGDAHPVALADTPGTQLNLSESWAPDGSAVIFQSAGTTSDIVLMQADGTLIARRDDMTFPRFGMAAAWSPALDRIAIGGTKGQCPYGVIVTNGELDIIARGNPPPSMCDPVFSSDGTYLAFTGVNPRIDGRVDLYIANANGFGTVNLTSDLRGHITLVGWVGGQTP
jgi:Tol biopolymer transport system component